jgi:hypothetical protein
LDPSDFTVFNGEVLFSGRTNQANGEFGLWVTKPDKKKITWLKASLAKVRWRRRSRRQVPCSGWTWRALPDWQTLRGGIRALSGPAPHGMENALDKKTRLVLHI